MKDKIFKTLAIIAGILLVLFILSDVVIFFKAFRANVKGVLVVLILLAAVILYKYLTRDKSQDGK